MKLGVFGVERVGAACALSRLVRGFRQSIERDFRYANITITEGNDASQFGTGIVSARIAKAVLREDRAVLPVGACNIKYRVTLSLPGVVGREGVSRFLESAMSGEERGGWDQSAESFAKRCSGCHRNPNPEIIKEFTYDKDNRIPRSRNDGQRYGFQSSQSGLRAYGLES